MEVVTGVGVGVGFGTDGTFDANVDVLEVLGEMLGADPDLIGILDIRSFGYGCALAVVFDIRSFG